MWAAGRLQALRRGRERFLADERVLGSRAFGERRRQEAEPQDRARLRFRAWGPELPILLRWVASAAGLPPTALTGGGRAHTVARARDGLAYLWVEALGRSGTELARALALRPVSVYRAARHGQTRRASWDPLLEPIR